MGNGPSTGSQLTAGIKKAQDSKNKLYQLVDLQGGGELLQWTKFALKSGDNSILDGLIEIKIQPFLYGGGKGKLVSISELVKNRNEERNANLGALQKKKGKGKSGPDILENVNQEAMVGDMTKVLKFLDGGGKGKDGQSKYRELCWDIKQRGVLGETLVHLCLLNGTTAHNELAKRLIQQYPKLVNDIHVSEEYYGETALHQAIINEDPSMVTFLLTHGADVNQRCYGNYFCPDDQKSTRTDSVEHEWVDLNVKTYYKGRTYWGEYPLSFAACLGQEDCFRILRAKKADINAKDTNGNTVLHMTVLHDQPVMFDLAVRSGAKIHITNNQSLTPLTLACKVGNKKMFEHVLEIERDIIWTYGSVSCAAYPLQYLDTIEEGTGNMNKVSALSLIVNEVSHNHMMMLDGLIEDLLIEKWNAFGKKELLKEFIAYVAHYVLFFTAFLLRDKGIKPEAEEFELPTNSTEATMPPHEHIAVGEQMVNESSEAISILEGAVELINSTLTDETLVEEKETHHSGFYYSDSCYLVHGRYNNINTPEVEKVRFILEGLCIISTFVFIAVMVKNIRSVGRATYFRTLLQFPERILHHAHFGLILLMVLLRLLCGVTFGDFDMADVENVVCIAAMFGLNFALLFFCRGVKFTGLFILMITKIITGDLLRFIAIYSILWVGFSQAFFIIFHGCCDDKFMNDKVAQRLKGYTEKDMENIMEVMNISVQESLFRSFIITLGDSSFFYSRLHYCKLEGMGKLLMVIYQLSAQILLINMFIAMVTKTSEHIGQSKTMWKRQWAKVILFLEQNLNKRDRLHALLKYSRPIGTDKTKRAFVVKWKQGTEEKAKEAAVRTDLWKKFIEEKKNAYKRRLQGDILKGDRPTTTRNGKN